MFRQLGVQLRCWIWKHPPLLVTICLPLRQTPASRGSRQKALSGRPDGSAGLRRRGFEPVGEPFCCPRLRRPARFVAVVYFTARWENRLRLRDKRGKCTVWSEQLVNLAGFNSTVEYQEEKWAEIRNKKRICLHKEMFQLQGLSKIKLEDLI